LEYFPYISFKYLIIKCLYKTSIFKIYMLKINILNKIKPALKKIAIFFHVDFQ